MLTERQFYDYYTDFDILITGMNERLLEAQKKNPEMDVERALSKINMLRRLQNVFHKMYHENMTIDNGAGKVLIERDKLLRRISQLEKENEELKQNIRL
jgi:hypothetical protein